MEISEERIFHILYIFRLAVDSAPNDVSMIAENIEIIENI